MLTNIIIQNKKLFSFLTIFTLLILASIDITINLKIFKFFHTFII